MGINKCPCNSPSYFLIIHVNGRISYDEVMDHLNNTCRVSLLFSRCWSLYKVVIRDLHHPILCTDIFEALTELGHLIPRVMSIIKFDHPLSLSYMDLKPNSYNAEIFDIYTLLNISRNSFTLITWAQISMHSYLLFWNAWHGVFHATNVYKYLHSFNSFLHFFTSLAVFALKRHFFHVFDVIFNLFLMIKII